MFILMGGEGDRIIFYLNRQGDCFAHKLKGIRASTENAGVLTGLGGIVAGNQHCERVWELV
jgi:hypothetical protein